MILGELVVIKVIETWVMGSSDIDDTRFRVGKIRSRWIASNDRNLIVSRQNAAGEKLVLMRTAGMREDCIDVDSWIHVVCLAPGQTNLENPNGNTFRSRRTYSFHPDGVESPDGCAREA